MSVVRVLREPLLHFVVAGGVLFAAFGLTPRAAGEDLGRIITVDEESLLEFLQYRSKAFKPEYFAAQLDAMSAEERRLLEREYVEEEMLFREAKALGLEEGDYVIRQRLVQKMRFLIDDLVDINDRPTEAALNEYLRGHSERYVVLPAATFTHVFTDSSVHGDEAAREAAQRLHVELNSRAAGFNDAPRFGDRFPFHQNYIERTFDYVASHFGNAFADAVKEIEPSGRRWRGPIRSQYGYHLVLVTDRTAARVPALDEIRAQVEDDWRRDRMEGARSQSLVRLAAQYTLERADRGKGQ